MVDELGANILEYVFKEWESKPQTVWDSTVDHDLYSERSTGNASHAMAANGQAFCGRDLDGYRVTKGKEPTCKQCRTELLLQRRCGGGRKKGGTHAAG